MDMNPHIVAKSDQLNADDLIGGPREYRISKVSANQGGDNSQPVNVYLEGEKVPFRPCKSMRRVLVRLWGADGSAYIGRRLVLYRDPDVKFGGVKVGGIRIKAMSDIAERTSLMLQISRGKKGRFVIDKLGSASKVQQSDAQRITPDEARDLNTRMVDLGVDFERFLQFFKIGELGELSKEQARQAGEMLDKRET